KKDEQLVFAAQRGKGLIQTFDGLPIAQRLFHVGRRVVGHRLESVFIRQLVDRYRRPAGVQRGEEKPALLDREQVIDLLDGLDDFQGRARNLVPAVYELRNVLVRHVVLEVVLEDELLAFVELREDGFRNRRGPRLPETIPACI